MLPKEKLLKNEQKVFELIVAERQHQDEKWPITDHPPEKWLTILVEEVGEVAKAILENDPALVLELVQTAAVCVRWLELITDADLQNAKTCNISQISHGWRT